MSEEVEESAARMNFNSSKRLNEASITVETSLSLLRLNRNQTDQKPSEAGFDRRGEATKWYGVFDQTEGVGENGMNGVCFDEMYLENWT